VKAGTIGRLRSLQLFMEEKSSTLAVRINSDLPSVVEAPIVNSRTGRESYRLLSLPFWLVGQVRRLVGAELGC